MNAPAEPQVAPARQLKSELARTCLPTFRSDEHRDLAWLNSICLLFLLIGLAGAKPGHLVRKTPPPVEEIIPTIIEPMTPPPTSAADQPPEENQNDAPADTAPAVVVTLNTPNINFAVPTVGNLLAPVAMAKAPPLSPMSPLRAEPMMINSTGVGGERPQPPYPKSAIEDREQGSVTLLITVDATGNLNSAQVKESSGYPLLDRTAAEFVRKNWRLPSINGARKFEATITYQIRLN